MKIYAKRQYLHSVMVGVWVCIVSALFVAMIGASTSRFVLMIALVLFSIVFGYSARRTWKISKSINQLSETRQSFAQAHNFSFMPIHSDLAGLPIALTHIHDSRDERFWNHIDAGPWQYCDFSYNYYRRTKYGEYRAGTVYYGIAFTKLPRVLPNVFFDSKKARGRQFRFTFSGTQLHSLEGDFDNYFATYFPDDYTIDSMSFITPDVMQAMIAASEYDIEIVGDTLYLYGPLSTDPNDIMLMSQKLNDIKARLLQNIMTYRDERLPMNVGRQTITPTGMVLKKSRFMQILTIVAVVLYVVGRIVVAMSESK